MEQPYMTVLQGVLEYEQKSLLLMGVIFAIALVTILLFVVIQFRKETVTNRIIMCSIVIVMFVVFGFSLISGYRDQAALRSDMEQDAFVTYTGTFIHDNYQKDSFYHNVTVVLEDGSKMILHYPDYGNRYHLNSHAETIPAGTGVGTIVDTKKSLVIVDYTSGK